MVPTITSDTTVLLVRMWTDSCLLPEAHGEANITRLAVTIPLKAMPEPEV